MRLFYGLNTSGELVHCSELDSSQASDLYCPHCKGHLVMVPENPLNVLIHKDAACPVSADYNFWGFRGIDLENSDRPLAELAWSKRVEMQVFYENLVREVSQQEEELQQSNNTIQIALTKLEEVSQPNSLRKTRSKQRQQNYEVLLALKEYIKNPAAAFPPVHLVRDKEAKCYFRVQESQGGWPNLIKVAASKLWNYPLAKFIPEWLGQAYRGLTKLHQQQAILSNSKHKLNAFTQERNQFESFRLSLWEVNVEGYSPLLTLYVTTRSDITNHSLIIEKDLTSLGKAQVKLLLDVNGFAFLAHLLTNKHSLASLPFSTALQYYQFTDAAIQNLTEQCQRIRSLIQINKIKEGMHKSRKLGVHTGRPVGEEIAQKFLAKPKSRDITRMIVEEGLSLREIQRRTKCSPNTIRKVNEALRALNLLPADGSNGWIPRTPAEQLLQQLLRKYGAYETRKNKGLFLFDLPTGFGKTYNILLYLYLIVQNRLLEKSDRKIFYITNLKKNLPLLELYQLFGSEEEARKHVLFIDSNTDCVIENLAKIERKLPIEILSKRSYKALKDKINELRSQPHLEAKIRHEIEEGLEKNFREDIQNYLWENSFYHLSIEERVELVKARYDWLYELYPAVLSSEYKIFFLTVSKFLVRNTTVITHSYPFQDRKFLDNALIFIDEFDASKDIVQNKMIEEQLQQKVDAIGLFSQLFGLLDVRGLSRKVLREGPKRRRKREEALAKGKEPAPTLLQIVEGLQQMARRVLRGTEEGYDLRKPVKTREVERSRNFLFNDADFYTILSNFRNYVQLQWEAENESNDIHFIKRTPTNGTLEGVDVIKVLNSVNNFLNYFKRQIAEIALNYIDLKREAAGPLINENYWEEFSFEMALRTLFNQLYLDETYQNVLIAQILTGSDFKQGREEMIGAYNFYANGFRYYEFHDSDKHDTQSKVFFYAFDTTPEQWLLNLAVHNRVIAVSATASLKTNLGNYDLAYLQSQLKEDFHTLSEEERTELRTQFDRENEEKYRDVELHTDFIDADSKDPGEQLRKLINNESILNKILRDISDTQRHPLQRYCRIIQAFKHFLAHDDIKSFLCFLTKFPKPADKDLDENLLKAIFELLVQQEGKEPFFAEGQYYVVLDSKHFKSQFNRAKDILKSNKKIFLLTTYQTVGAGQNLQYEIPSGESTESALNVEQMYEAFLKFPKKDLDAIYLDKPTHILVHLDDKNIVTDESFNKRLFQLQYIAASGEISRDDLMLLVKQAFGIRYEQDYLPQKKKKLTNIEQNNPSGLPYQTTHYINALVRVLVQAVGRMNRTSRKNRHIYLWADAAIAPYLVAFAPQDGIYLKEFTALRERAIRYCKLHAVNDLEIVGEEQVFANILKNKHLEVHRIHATLLAGINSTGSYQQQCIKEWQAIRPRVLAFPTLSKEDYDKTRFKALYIPFRDAKASSYAYGEHDDYKHVSVKLGGKEYIDSYQTGEKKNTVPVYAEISAESARLSDAMKIPALRAYFEEKGYATNFIENEYILSPLAFNNYYKGALGEVIGSYVLERECGFQLQDMEHTHFEVFDSIAQIGSQKLYIDFKHYSDKSGRQDADSIIKNIIKKMDRTGARAMAVLNAFGDSKYEYRPIHVSDGRRIIIVPYLINEQNELDIDSLKNHLEYVTQEAANPSESIIN